MSTFYRLIGMLVVLSSLLAGCAPAATPTPVPAADTPLPATATPVPPTRPPLPPTAEPQPTLAPTPAREIPQVIWDKGYNKTRGDMGEDFLAAEAGGYYIVGTAGLDMSGAGLSGDVYLIRTDADGKTLWDKTYGGAKADEGLSIARTRDGNLLLAGTTKSFGAGGSDAYLIKVTPEGKELWSKTFGGPLDESASVRELAEGGFMLWGNSVNPQDFIADPGAAGYGGYAGRSNVYLAKTDAEGNELWSHTFGDQNNLLASAGVQTPDGGFVVLASLLRYPDPGDDIYLLKVDKNGDKVWEHTWEEGTMSAYDLIPTSDDNYLIAGAYLPLNEAAQSKADFLFIKVDQQGTELWLNIFGAPDMMDYPMAVAQTADGGYLAAGDWVKDWSGRYPGSISLTKIGPDGKLVWEKTIKPDSGHNIVRAILQQPDGTCLLVGSRLVRQQFEIYLMKVDIGMSGAYLGQTPPGLTPQVFAPGIVSISSTIDYAGTFSPDGTEFYFTRRVVDEGQNIYETHLVNGVWSEPAPVAFSAAYDAHEPHVTADNKTLYFGWFSPPPPGEVSWMEAGIWATDRTTDGWSEPRYVGEGMFVSSDQSGQIYATSFATGAPSLGQVTLSEGRFANWKNLSAGVHPAIAPDGSYLVYDNGDGNFRVRFLAEDGTWGGAKDLTKQGIPVSAAIASISPDGKYLFYVDRGDLYWVSTVLIKNLKEE